MENFAQDFSWIGIAFFYTIALGFAFGQIWLMNREIKKDKAKAASKRAEEKEAAKAQEDGES